jgi:ribosome-binding ATPase YchF (GTP1/OBG family)
MCSNSIKRCARDATKRIKPCVAIIFSDLMLIGLVGSPNKGKSTLFSALTMAEAEIADYPFTTINPNLGVAYATRKCVDAELGVKCRPRNSLCTNGTRQIPVNVTDVAGLVPGASVGKGRGSQFLNDLSAADVLVLVIDASGSTDINGNPSEGSDPAVEVRMVCDELAKWLSGILLKHMQQLSKRADGAAAISEVLSGFKADEDLIKEAAGSAGLPLSYMNWSSEAAYAFSSAFLKESKPMFIAANKMDRSSREKLDSISSKLQGYAVIGCSAAIELALKKASESGSISYFPGSSEFRINKEPNPEQRKALSYMGAYLRSNGATGVQQLLNLAVFSSADNIVVYPVEDEKKYTDHFGNCLPDAILMKKGSTALDLALKIHTDLAERMLYAIDARTRARLQKEYVLKDNDVIKIVSAAK